MKKKNLEDIIIKDFEAAIKDTAIELNQHLAAAYTQSVEAFYNDYEPKYYKRTGSLYDGSNLTKSGLISGYNEKNIKNPKKNNNGYYAEIKVSPKFIHGKPYRADVDWVFERFFFKGIHGQSDTERRQWGNNEWWDTYLRTFPKYRNFPEDLRVNQYREYRNMFMRKGSLGGSFFGLNMAGLTTGTHSYSVISGNFGFSALEKKWISGNETKMFNLVELNRHRHSMSSKKPIDLLYNSYKQLRKRKNIELIFHSKLIHRLGQ